MATSTDEVLVRFTTEGGQEVVKTFKDVGDQSEQFHQKVSKAGNALGDLRLKSEGRVANNVGAIAQALTGGASAGEVFATAITKVSESFRGSLLFAGAATVGFALYEGITKAGEAVIALEAKLSDLKRSTSVSGDFIGADQVSKNLDASVAALDDLKARFVTEHAGLGGLFDRALRGGLRGLTGGQLESDDAINIAKARQSILGALDQTAEKQKTLNAITREGLSGDERKAALDKIDADHKERAARIAAAEVKVGIIGGGKASQKEKERFENEKDAANKIFDQRQFQLDLERDLVQVQGEFLDPQNESLQLSEEKVKSLERELQVMHLLTVQERERLGTQLQSARNTEALAAARSLPYGGKEGFAQRFRDRFNAESRKAFLDEKDKAGQLTDDDQEERSALDRFQAGDRLGTLEEIRRNTIFGKGPAQERSRNKLLDDIADARERVRNLDNIRAPDRRRLNRESGQEGNSAVVGAVHQLIQTLNALPAKIGVQ